MKFKLIVCVNESNYIGKDNNLLYHIKDDLKRFKRLTNENIVIMGRKTYESLPKRPLPNRINVVLTRDKNYKSDNCVIVNSVGECYEFCEKYYPKKDAYVIGGAHIYNAFLRRHLIDTLELTVVHDNKDGDTTFPLNINNLNANINSQYYWKFVKGFMNNVSEDGTKFSYVTYKRKRKINLINLVKRKISCIFAVLKRKRSKL